LLQRLFLEPWSTLLHLIAALLAIPGMGLLLWLARGEPGKFLSLLVYAVSVLLLFGASCLLHGVKAPRHVRDLLNRLDHMAIFLVIAGTYTPVVYNLFPPAWRWPLLVFVWTVAVAAMLIKLVSKRIHGFFNVFIYPLLGWGGTVPLTLDGQLLAIFPRPALALLLLGGLIYTVGFVIYYFERPDPWPNHFGHHEIWHLFVVAGTGCHYLFMLLYVAG